ncbi:MAG: prolipoprotein diacylglyceryl transferase [Puniceicoccales bacterium]|jgi:phosphatidylglycerol:prolipoprotein diacylglycerol transferase|nr:prolipoprotein diacylglyceryl transferase [Puniceicoccales bacterium]
MIAQHYVHSINPFAIKFPDGWCIQGIRWYGLFYLLAFAFTIFALNFYTLRGKSRLTREQNFSFLSYAIGGVIIGGRLGYMLLYYFEKFLKNPLEIFAIWHGGMSSHGGFAGVIIAMIVFCKRNNIRLLPLADICSTIAPFGFFLGRVANFINGELYGKISEVKWAVIFPQSTYFTANIFEISARHPSQLYEAFLEGLLLFAYVQIRFWSKKNIAPGQLSGEFLILYAIFRIFTECFREPDAELILAMSRGQFYSIFLLIFGIVLAWISGKISSENNLQ